MKGFIYEKTDGVARVRFNRPESRNALDLSMREELGWIISNLKKDPEIRVVAISAEGKSFCAGGDIKTMGGKEQMVGGKERVMRICDMIYDLAYLEKPVVAAVNGAATGAGLSIALCCDLVIASDRAKFGAPFTRIGLVPDTGTTYFLPRVVGLAKAREMILTGNLIDAQEALRVGLITRIVPHENLVDEFDKVVSKFSTRAYKALGMAKINMLRALDADLRAANLFETYSNGLLFHSKDHKEGINAFVDKRDPVFEGK